MASTDMNQQQSLTLGRAVENEHIFATLRAVRDPGEKLMDCLGKHYSTMTDHHRGYLKVKPKGSCG